MGFSRMNKCGEEPRVSCLTRYIAYVTVVQEANGKIANALQINLCKYLH